MFACLDWALTLKMVHSYTVWHGLILIHMQAVTRFMQLTDYSEDVPPLRNKKYRLFHLSKSKWIQLKHLHELMKVSHFLCAL
jgi:hypothetical protein